MLVYKREAKEISLPCWYPYAINCGDNFLNWRIIVYQYIQHRWRNWGTLLFVSHRSTPLAFLKTVLQCVSPLWPDLSQPLWGMITMFTNTNKASSMIVLLRSSHELRFQSTPVTSSFTSLSWVFRSNLTKAFVPPAVLIALLFSSFWRPYDRFLKIYPLIMSSYHKTMF